MRPDLDRLAERADQTDRLARDTPRAAGRKIQHRILFPKGSVVQIRSGELVGSHALVSESVEVEASGDVWVQLYDISVGRYYGLPVRFLAGDLHRLSWDRSEDGESALNPAPEFPL